MGRNECNLHNSSCNDELNELQDEDFADYQEFLEEEELSDAELLKQLENGEV